MAKAKRQGGWVGMMNSLPLLLKVIFALPVLDAIFYGIYRIAKGKVLLGVLWFFLGCFAIGTIIDIIGLLLNNGKIRLLA